MSCRELQERDAAMAAHREVWDSERGTIVADLLRLAAKRQDAVHAQREDLDRRLAAARQLSSASPPIQACSLTYVCCGGCLSS